MMQYLDLQSLHAYLCVGEYAYLCGPGHSSNATDEERALLNCGATIIKYSKYLKDDVLYC